MEPKPFRSPSLSQDSDGTHEGKREERTVVMMEGKKKAMNEGSQPLIKCEKPLLTPAQLFEFQRQVLIFEHMKAGLPVPRHVWIPIWKDVASSFGPDDRDDGIYKLYPSFVGLGLPQKVDRKVDHRNMMDLEPGRCRRTDGNKWRCSKNVIPDQKYCERHMHRGCSRSRKHVEALKVANPLGKNSSKDSENLKAISGLSQNVPNPQPLLPLTLVSPCDSKNSKTIGTLSQLPTLSSKTSSVTTTSIKDENKNDSMFVGENNSNIVRGKTFATTIDAANKTNHIHSILTPSFSIITSEPVIINTASNDTNNDVINCINTATDTKLIPPGDPMTLSGPSLTITNSSTTTNINKKNSVSKIIKRGNNDIIAKNVSTGYDFSPKSVLHVRGYRGSGIYRNDDELGRGRCGRTDGKKWRCSRNVVPNQKYCDRHMHRGAKKRVEAKYPVAKFTTVSTSSMPTSRNADSKTSNTIFSISMEKSPQVATTSPASSSSDATISDTIITANEEN